MRSSLVLRGTSAYPKIGDEIENYFPNQALAGKGRSSMEGALLEKQQLGATFLQLFIIILRILASAAPV